MKKPKHSVSGDDNWLCADCGKDTFIDPKDFYMIRFELWDIIGVGGGMLCMDCIEKRVGHALTKNEILPCPLTEYINPYTSKILNY